MESFNQEDYSPETLAAGAMFERLPQEVKTAILELMREMVKEDTKSDTPTRTK